MGVAQEETKFPTLPEARTLVNYYPYGKTLRQYKECNQNRYLSTHHERDKDTGYDNRGARLYDSEIGRFLGVDPLAGKFKAWSPYNYVMGDPATLVDPTGASPEGYTVYVDVEQVSASEQSHWNRQIGIYNQKQSFVEAVQNAFLKDIYRDAAGLLAGTDSKGAENIEALGGQLNTQYTPPPRSNIAHYESVFDDVSIQIGEHSIDVKQITFFHRGDNSVFDEITQIGAFSAKGTLSSIGGSNIAAIYGKVGAAEIDLGPGRTPIRPGSVPGKTHLGLIEMSSLEVTHYQNAARYLTRDVVKTQINQMYETQALRNKAMDWLRYQYPNTFRN